MELYTNFYIENKSRVFAYLLHLTGDYHLSRDLLQESFTRYLSHYGATARNRSLLYTIARNAAFDEARKRREEPLQPNHEPTCIGNPETSLSEKQSVDRILKAISKLTENDRELIAMVATGHFTYKEIGVIQGISEATVKVRVHRARLRLRDILNSGG